MYSLGNCIEYDVNVKIDTRKKHVLCLQLYSEDNPKIQLFQKEKSFTGKHSITTNREGLLLHYRENTSIVFPNMWKSCLIGAIIVLRINNILTYIICSIILFVQCKNPL